MGSTYTCCLCLYQSVHEALCRPSYAPRKKGPLLNLRSCLGRCSTEAGQLIGPSCISLAGGSQPHTITRLRTYFNTAGGCLEDRTACGRNIACKTGQFWHIFMELPARRSPALFIYIYIYMGLYFLNGGRAGRFEYGV